MEIGVIFTGGTIGSAAGENGITISGRAPYRLLAEYREKSGDLYDFPTDAPYSILSENLTFSHLGQLNAAIEKMATKVDAMIVTHGTDTLHFTAAALSYLRGLSSKPVVLVSSNYVLGDPRANGTINFLAAVDFLRGEKDARGVFVAYRNKGDTPAIHRAARLLPQRAFEDAVVSVGGALAKIEGGRVIPLPTYHERPDEVAPFGDLAVENATGRVLSLAAHPDMYYPPLSPDVAAVLLTTDHSGTLGTSTEGLRRFAADAAKRQIPVFLAGVPRGGTTYASGNLYGALKLTPLPPISPTAAYIKLSLAVAAGRDLYRTMASPLGGDL